MGIYSYQLQHDQDGHISKASKLFWEKNELSLKYPVSIVLHANMPQVSALSITLVSNSFELRKLAKLFQNIRGGLKN